MLPPHASERMHTAIELRELRSVQIGKPSSNAADINQFTNVVNGIYSVNTNVDVYHNNFEDTDYPMYGQHTGTHGGGRLHVNFGNDDNGNLIYKNTISNALTALRLINLDALVQRNEITGAGTGIWCQSGRNPEIEISYNTMEEVKYGIRLSNFINARLKVCGNNIETSALLGNAETYGIALFDQENSNNQLLCKGNNITSQGRYGIYLINNDGSGYSTQNPNAPAVDSNEITLSHPQNPKKVYAIRLENCRNNHVGDNVIDNASTYKAKRRAISFSNTSSGGTSQTGQYNLFCDSMSNVAVGMEFLGVCTNTDVQGNTFNEMDTCLTVGSSITAGSFSDLNGVMGFAPTNLFVDPSPQIQLMNWNPDQPLSYSVTSGEQSPPDQQYCQNWEIELDLLNLFDCSFPHITNGNPGKFTQPDTTKTETYYSIISGEKDFGVYQDAWYDWSLKRKLYEELAMNEALISQNSVHEQFVDTAGSGNIGLLHNIGQAITQATETTTNQDSLITAALELNKSLQSNLVFENNYKTVNRILIPYFFYGTEPDTLSRDSLIMIANQCPFEGGEAVYAARSYLNGEGDFIYYDDDALCYHSNGMERSSLNFNLCCMLAPNPGGEFITLFYALPENENNSTLFVYDVYGHIEKQITLPMFHGMYILETVDFPPGVYFFSLVNNGRKFYEGRIVITH